jgi:signal transduction histidine kinase/ligand-binding sensor domain-containing protein/DNA-binding response OmpR family regulator
MNKRILILFCLLFIVNCLSAHASPIQFHFEKFAYTDKLPSNSVIRIYNDKEGYMWFGTKDGLCRFDGYNIKVFRSSALTPGKLTNNEIRCITEDNDHRLWVGTVEGINIIDKKTYSITPFVHPFINKERINSIFIDSKGYIWIGTSNYGALRIHPKNGNVERFSTDKDARLKLRGNTVTDIYEDHHGNIWLCSWKNGLCCIDPGCKQVVYAPKIGSNNNPFRFYQDKDGLYWICTWGDGIFTMTRDEQSGMNVRPIVLSKNSVKKTDDIVYSITQDDKYGYIWVVTFSGLTLIEKQPDGTCSLVDADAFFEETSNKLFHEVSKDRSGNLWIGSVGEGLYKLDFNKLSVQNFPLSEIKNTLNVPSYVTRFCEVPTGKVFIFINRLGLFCFNPQNGEIRRPENEVVRGLRSVIAMVNISNSNELWVANEGEDMVHVFATSGPDNLVPVRVFSLSNFRTPRENNITNLFEDSQGNVWIGASNGLYLKPKNSFVRLISSKIQYITTIGEDTEHKIWAGTEKEGAFVCKPALEGGHAFYSFSKVSLNINSYQSYSVQSICCKKNGDVYLGTKEGCLYFYDQKKRVASEISGLYGITEEGILDILEDNYGVLWISTIKRIVRYNPEARAATYYSNADGMLMSSAFKDARIKLKSGQILFGGNKGISAFNPSSHSTLPKPRKQHVVVSDILVQNKSIFDDAINLHFNVGKNRVTLQPSESNLSIEFSALDFTSANKIQYAYMLSGVDNNWIYVGNNRRFVNYANLPSGKYKFMVKASDENGLWSNQITSLEVMILPPLYRTWWAYVIYLTILLGAAYIVAKTITNRILLNNELQISHIEKEKSEELAQIKLRYFTNISHELLTPLTIIMLLIENLQKKNRNDASQYEMMKTNVNRLKRLIQQILVFRKTESGNMKLRIRQNDIVAFVNNICHSNFHPLVVEKEIHFAIQAERESYMAYFDPDKLDKVLYNLLSNAFKHTPKGGCIGVTMSFLQRQDDTFLRLSVSDSGDGIAAKDLPHIFQRFYISSTSDQSQSHGIGLSLTSDLLEIHKGGIEVKSQLGEGAVFTMEIPVSKGAYKGDEFADDEAEEVQFMGVPETPEDIIPSEPLVETAEETEKKEDCTILVVEDNLSLKNLMVEHFTKRYAVLSAENGFRALDIIHENEVDLVISDVMMPEMDGLILCKTLKNDIATSHISVLMLTARNSTEDRIECYNAGADAYIAKPFELRVLVARAKNLIGKRQQKTKNFQRNQEINISSMEYGSIDEAFLKDAVLKVEAKLSDTNFDFDQFAIDLGTSKSTLHRKLKSLTGLAPGEFIRNIRLKHASRMLLVNTGNISEIAYSVGFNDPKYFARCFKGEFGLTPREYQDSKREDSRSAL